MSLHSRASWLCAIRLDASRRIERQPSCFCRWSPDLVTGLRHRVGRLMLTKGTGRKGRAEQRLGPAQRQRLSVQRNLLEDHGRLDSASAEPQSLLCKLPSVLSQIGPQLDRFVKREGPAYAAVWLRSFLPPRLADFFE